MQVTLRITAIEQETGRNTDNVQCAADVHDTYIFHFLSSFLVQCEISSTLLIPCYGTRSLYSSRAFFLPCFSGHRRNEGVRREAIIRPQVGHKPPRSKPACAPFSSSGKPALTFVVTGDWSVSQSAAMGSRGHLLYVILLPLLAHVAADDADEQIMAEVSFHCVVIISWRVPILTKALNNNNNNNNSNDNNNDNIDRRIYLNLSKSIQSATLLKL